MFLFQEPLSGMNAKHGCLIGELTLLFPVNGERESCNLCVFKCSLVSRGLIMSDVFWVLCGHVKVSILPSSALGMVK